MLIRLALFLFLLFNVILSGYIQAQSIDQELNSLKIKYDLSMAQQLRVKQLITVREQSMETINHNIQFDELHRSLKRSAIIEGFEHSILLVLDPQQRSIATKDMAAERIERAKVIEQMKKDGYSQVEIVDYLNKQSKVKSVNE